MCATSFISPPRQNSNCTLFEILTKLWLPFNHLLTSHPNYLITSFDRKDISLIFSILFPRTFSSWEPRLWFLPKIYPVWSWNQFSSGILGVKHKTVLGLFCLEQLGLFFIQLVPILTSNFTKECAWVKIGCCCDQTCHPVFGIARNWNVCSLSWIEIIIVSYHSHIIGNIVLYT